MELSKQLVLSQYLLAQFGYEDFEDVQEEFNDKNPGTSATGITYFASAIMGQQDKLVSDKAIETYDKAILEYQKKLQKNRAEPYLTFKYYQWLALLFTEYFFDSYSSDASQLVKDLNKFQDQQDGFGRVNPYTEDDLKKIAYWMATGSGKTLIMHCNFWQAQKYFEEWENIILITPNEGLSRQHYDDFVESGIDCHIYTGSEESLKTEDEEVLIIDIHKLTQNKIGEGVSVDVNYFSESQNLVFIDEGHKGSKSEEKTWKKLREHLVRGEGSFTFEYSATFGQVITKKNKFLFDEYGKSIIIDYSYKHFHSDGYGKDFSVFNLDAKNDYDENQKRLLLTASLLGYYEQLDLYERYQDELKEYNIEKPLWIFVGSRVLGSGTTDRDKATISDVTTVVKFFKHALSNPVELQNDIDAILSNNSGLINDDGDDIFKNRFQHLKKHRPKVDNILSSIFNGIGSIEAYEIKHADGEIALKTKTGDKYFAVINIGDVSKYGKTLEEDTDGDLTIQDDNIARSLFDSIDDHDSTINILLGSKKFIEGWNSWRVASMGLMNMGKSEGPQIIQLFGRGVRLKGKSFSLKREGPSAPYFVKALQTISIMGLNASYMNRFLEEIEKEVPEYTEKTFELKFNRIDEWDNQIMTFKKKKDYDFANQLIELSYNSEIAKRITVDLRSKVVVAEGDFHSQVAESSETYEENIIAEFSDFLDYDRLTLEANKHKLLKGFNNLIIRKSVFKKLMEEGDHKVYVNKGQFGVLEAINGDIQQIAVSIAKDYVNKFYSSKEKAYLSDNLTYEMLDHSKHQDMFPENGEMIVKAPEKYKDVIDELEENIKLLYKKDDDTLPTIHFDKHLYSPIASTKNGKKYKEVKTTPVRLNDSERDFIDHLREYIRESDVFKGKEIFILRNLSVRGLGFYMESSSFYPDFIVWVVDGSDQYIYFLDPKGILLGETHFNNPKILWCNKDAPDLEKQIKKDLKDDDSQLKVSISAFILSGTPFEKVKKNWSEGNTTKKDFEEHNVLFIEEDKHYLEKVFENLG